MRQAGGITLSTNRAGNAGQGKNQNEVCFHPGMLVVPAGMQTEKLPASPAPSQASATQHLSPSQFSGYGMGNEIAPIAQAPLHVLGNAPTHHIFDEGLELLPSQRHDCSDRSGHNRPDPAPGAHLVQ